MIKYLGSKKALLGPILRAIGAAAGEGAVVADLFSGSARVAHAVKAAGWQVLANDELRFAQVLARGVVQADAEAWGARARRLLADFADLPPAPGWFTETYAGQARYLHPANAARIEAVREAIRRLEAEPELEAVLLAALLQAADRVDSSPGHQMAFLRALAPRALKPLALRLPDLLPRPASGPCLALGEDAVALAAAIECDVAYLDPPYDQHAYLANYHLWETLVRWDRPEVYGRACKRTDCRTRRSPFNRRAAIGPAFATLVAALRAPTLVVSFGAEGFLGRAELERMLAGRGYLHVLEVPHRRYAGTRLGIHNGRGEKVGRPGPAATVERLYVASDRLLDLPADQPWCRVP
ncbi:DNA methyltransferase [Roseomonas sp. BU-1]|uniref:site-specific DNA-methyltransferase (adenine-specific) n=1 Tax=Falsiroseomonas selenitidurans TaxID=2716335 RepID=A0ABX1E825_9PROT|nr:DNA methyltransferase [Falsiroseomonas selenitidurans]